MGRYLLNGWKSISASFIAGILSFPLSWLACATADGILAIPLYNAALGTFVSFVVYVYVFALIEDRTVKSVLKRLGWRLGLELAIRGILHILIMMAGYSAASASLYAQLISGLAGHLSVPYFLAPKFCKVNLAKIIGS